MTTHPFDVAASGYDADFTHRRLGRWVRDLVREHLHFEAGQHVLELGCGTGEDALWLAEQGIHVMATDAATQMVQQTQQKVAQANLSAWVEAQVLDMNALTLNPAPKGEGLLETKPSPFSPGEKGDGGMRAQYDAVFSNFGAVNCVQDYGLLAGYLAQQVNPGGKVIMVLMGRWCPWEILWYLAHLQPKTAFRRVSAGKQGVEAHVGDGQTVRVWYPAPSDLKRAFAPHFRHVQTVGIGTLLPPSYLDHLVERWPRTFERFAGIDRRFGQSWLMQRFNDHYLIEFARTEASV